MLDSQFVKNRQQAMGFTLIELLVAIAIIAILASILAPVIAEARGSVYGVRCQYNLRQIGEAAAMYCQDYDERYASPSGQPFGLLPDLHEPYLTSYRMWTCPSDSKATGWDGIWGSNTFYTRSSYMSNAYIFQGSAGSFKSAIGLSEVNYPSQTPLWMDGFSNPGWATDAVPISDPDPVNAYLHNTYGDNLNSKSTDPSAASCWARQANPALDRAHHLGANYVFSDGHCRWRYSAQFTTTDLMRATRVIDDPTDPMLQNGARSPYNGMRCPVFCCPQPYGMPPNDGDHPWFRP